MLGKNFSRRHFEIFFSLFPGNMTYHANCLKRINPVFWRKIKKNIINLSSAELAQWVVKINTLVRFPHNSPQRAHDVIQRRLNVDATSCAWRLYNVGSTSMQRHDVASTLRRRFINVMCLLGQGRQLLWLPVCFLILRYLLSRSLLEKESIFS